MISCCPAEARSFPSGANATDRTTPVCREGTGPMDVPAYDREKAAPGLERRRRVEGCHAQQHGQVEIPFSLRACVEAIRFESAAFFCCAAFRHW